MAKPNYSFEKRQRELAKKKKKEDKLKEKAERKSAAGSGADDAAQGDEPDAAAPPQFSGHREGGDDVAASAPSCHDKSQTPLLSVTAGQLARSLTLSSRPNVASVQMMALPP